MKYIDSEKLIAEIESRESEIKSQIAELGNFESNEIGLFNYLGLYDDILSFITSLQQEQNCIFGNTPSEEACKYCGVVCSSRVPKIITSTSTKVSPSPKEVADKDEQIGLSIMAYLDSNIKSDKHKVCGVPLKTAREWIRKMIAYSQEQPEVEIEKEITEHAINMPHGEFSHDSECREHEEWAMKEFRHFYELGLNARKEEQI